MSTTEERIGRIIQSFATAALDPAEWWPALNLMSDEMGSASSALELADLNTGAASINCTFPMDDHLIQQYEERVYHINPRVQRARRSPVGVLLDDRTLLVDGDPHMAEFMDWLGKTPNRYLVGAKLYGLGGHEIYFGSYFSASHGAPQAWHEKVHQLVIPHLVNVVAVGKVLSENALKNVLLTQSHLETGRPFALLDRAGRLLECSAGFEAILASRKILDVRNRSLVSVHPEHRAVLDIFLSSAFGRRRLIEPPTPIRLAAPDSPRGLILRALPVPAGRDFFDLFRPAAVVTITDLDQPYHSRRRELEILYDLTPREAEIASLVSGGHAPEEAAESLRISTHTVRQHLKSVFGKLGVSRQAELVSLCARIFQ